MPDIPRISTAESVDELLEAGARFLWHEKNPGEACPDEQIPTEGTLATWYTNRDNPIETAAEVQRRVNVVLGGAWFITSNIQIRPGGAYGTHNMRFTFGVSNGNNEPDIYQTWAQVHQAWRNMEPATRPDHPLIPLIKEWQARPTEIQHETRKDKQIIPHIRGQETRPERVRGQVFGGLVPKELPALPTIFEEEPTRKDVGILSLYDEYAKTPVMAKGKGAPLAARLFIRAGLAVSPRDRNRESVRMAVTVRELRDWLYPNGWQAGRDWPNVRDALMKARDITVPSPSGGRWFLLAVRHLPGEDSRGRPLLDDHVILDMAFPPGTGSGAPIDLQTMDALSVQSAPAWRAFIATRALNWIPGTTQRPVPGRAGRWGWSRDIEDYPILTLEDRRRLAFGNHDHKHRTHREIDQAWRNLPDTVIVATKEIDRKTGQVGWRVLPADVAEQIGADGED